MDKHGREWGTNGVWTAPASKRRGYGAALFVALRRAKRPLDGARVQCPDVLKVHNCKTLGAAPPSKPPQPDPSTNPA